MVSYWWLITTINNVLKPTVEITSHTNSHTQHYSIESKDVKNKQMKILGGSKIHEKVKLIPSNFTKIKTPSRVAKRNFAKILIQLSVYISLNSEIIASKICEKSQGITTLFFSSALV